MTNEKDMARLVEKLLGPVLDALTDRDAKNASRTAGGLTFWRDGMLGDLEKISTGDYDQKTVASLKQKFEDSETRVSKAMEDLHSLRGRLAPSKIADQIDSILHHNEFGKGSIREGIQILLYDFEPGSIHDDTAQYASQLCGKIRTLNAELQKLGRMVRG